MFCLLKSNALAPFNNLALFAQLILAIVDIEKNDSVNGSLQCNNEKRRYESINRLPRRVKVSAKKKFSTVIEKDFPDVTFRRYFQVGQPSFWKFAALIRDKVGDDVFKPEQSWLSTTQTTKVLCRNPEVPYAATYNLLFF
jgi:hypothetical protein